MLDYAETLAAPPAGTRHLVQLFDSDESIANGVAGFFREGLIRNDVLLAVMDEERWYAVAMRLSALGSPVDDVLRTGQLTVRNARETLTEFMVGDRPHPERLTASVGTLVASLASRGRPLRIYGEMVDVLAARGQYAAAHELEELWNELGRRHNFTLFCGYTAGHFGDPRNAADLRRICAAHGEVQADPQDVLGSFLTGEHRTQPRRNRG
jgi:hypothetical protein